MGDLVSLAVLGGLSALMDGCVLGVVYLLIHLLILYVFITVTVKRLHDTDRSGWWPLMGFVPVIGWIYFIVVCGFFKGTVGENRYGSP